MSIPFNFNDHIVDDLVDGVVVWDKSADDSGQRWRHGCAHQKKGLRDNAESTLPEIRHVACVTNFTVSFAIKRKMESDILCCDVL